jgi:hypothetical protein
MKCWIVKPYVAVFALMTLLPACSAPPENSASSNSNAPQQANSNSQEQPVAQSNAPSAPPSTSPLTLQQLPPPALAAKPAEKAMAAAAAKANTATAGSGRPPKLIVPEKRLDFGKQPQDKTMVRAIPIRNGGLGVLNIESVSPS